MIACPLCPRECMIQRTVEGELVDGLVQHFRTVHPGVPGPRALEIAHETVRRAHGVAP